MNCFVEIPHLGQLLVPGGELCLSAALAVTSIHYYLSEWQSYWNLMGIAPSVKVGCLYLVFVFNGDTFRRLYSDLILL